MEKSVEPIEENPKAELNQAANLQENQSAEALAEQILESEEREAGERDEHADCY